MAKVKINRVANANVYLNGTNFLGRAQEVQLPEVKQITTDHKGLGMVGTAELPSGLDKMECKITWASVYEEVLRLAGNPRDAVQLQVRSSIDSYTGQGRTGEVGIAIMMAGYFKSVPLGTFKKDEPVTPESTMTVHYVKYTVDGQDILEIDVFNNVYKTGGTDDLLRTFRQLIGG